MRKSGFLLPKRVNKYFAHPPLAHQPNQLAEPISLTCVANPVFFPAPPETLLTFTKKCARNSVDTQNLDSLILASLASDSVSRLRRVFAVFGDFGEFREFLE